MSGELPAEKYKPLENEGQSELYDFERGGELEARSQQYAFTAAEKSCDAEDALEEIENLPEDLEELRAEALSNIRDLKDRLSSSDVEQDDWAI